MPQPRGTPVRILRLSQAIARRGHEVHLVTYPLGDGPLPSELAVHRIPRIPTYRKRTPGPSLQKLLLLDPLLAAALGRVLRQGRFDVIHAHHYEGLIAARIGAAGAGVPIVYDAHTLLASELPSYRVGLRHDWKKGIGARLDRWLPRQADHVIAVTEAIRTKLVAAGVSPDRVTVASQGIEDEFFGGNGAVPGEEARAEPMEAAEVPRGTSLVYAGNLARYQGIELLLDAFRRVRERRPNVRLRILSRSSFAPYEELAQRLGVRGAIELVPAGVDELPGLLRAADVALNPRVDCDGIPIKLLNYMATARPIVSFAGSAPVLRHDESALLVADGDTAAFAAAVLDLLGDPVRAARLGQRGRRYAEDHHRWASIAA
ncbi:MAG: glycosyltransferase family 4 protein, partial [Gemmatimonadota bacterium]